MNSILYKLDLYDNPLKLKLEVININRIKIRTLNLKTGCVMVDHIVIKKNKYYPVHSNFILTYSINMND